MSGTLNQPGLGAGDNASADQATPPDTTGAIGPTAYVEVVNSRVAAYSRATLGQIGSSVALDAFVGASGDSVFDPQIQWDPQAGRWFYVAIDNVDLAYGWSKTADPTDFGGGWCHFFQAADSGTTEDYPKLGHDDAHILVGTNVFTVATESFVTARVWSVAKPAPGSTTCPGSAPATKLTPSPLRTASNQIAFTPVPANASDGSSTGWVVSAEDSGDRLQVWRVTGTGSSPSFASVGEVAVSAFAAPPPVPQPGTSNTLDSLDDRLTQAVAHADPDAGGAEAIWTQHTIATSDGLSAVRWYELLPATLALRQQGNVVDSGLSAFNGAISPTSAGNEAVVQYDAGGSSQLPEMRAQSRRSATPLGQMASEVSLAQSSQADVDATCTSDPSCRWGDYAGASPDPSNSGLVWASNQVIGPPQLSQGYQWLTRNVALVPTGRPPVPTIGSPDPVGRGNLIRLDASRSTTDGQATDFAWDLDGDGSFEHDTGATPFIDVTFTRDGPATVSLRVTDDRGQSAVASRTLTVAEPPPLPASAVIRDLTAPLVRLSLKRTQKLRGYVLVTASCSESCLLKATLDMPSRTVKRLHLARRVGGVSRRLKANRKTKIKVPFTRKARKGLKRASRIRVKLLLVATDAAGNARRVSRKITLRR